MVKKSCARNLAQDTLIRVTEEAREYITDPKALRALSHPTRWTIVELLGLEDTATATRCAEYSGESVASCSYHLSMLAKYGFVEQVQAPGREKPWKLARRDQSWKVRGLDTEAAMAAETLSEVFLDHETSRMKDWVRRASRDPEEWQSAAGMSASTIHVTADELVELRERIAALTAPYVERRHDPAGRPDGARAVRVFVSTWLPRTGGER
jgi:predicted ArsR family transcriptional regulator